VTVFIDQAFYFRDIPAVVIAPYMTGTVYQQEKAVVGVIRFLQEIGFDEAVEAVFRPGIEMDIVMLFQLTELMVGL
jgi:hypothetical protein